MSETKKVLVVEDDSFLLGLISNKLKKNGFEVETAQNGEKAMTSLVNEKYEVLLLDLMLPDISGFDILENLHNSKRKLPVIVFSNLSEDKDIKRAMDLGAKEYLIKSNFTLEELVEKINKII